MQKDSWVADHLEELAPEWLGLPVELNRHGFRWRLGPGEYGGLLANDIHYLRGREWLPVNRRPQPDHSGGFGFEHNRDAALAGGSVRQGPLTYALRSIGVEQRGAFREVWRPGYWGVGLDRMDTKVGPFTHVTRFKHSRKTELLLPEMPSVDGDSLVLDYSVVGMPPPETCACRPVAIDSLGVEVPMWKRRTPWGKQEGIRLEDLSRLAFPVILDPEIGTGGWCNPRAIYTAATPYATVHSTANGNGAACFFLGQGNNAGFWNISRHASYWNAAAYAGIVTSGEVKLSRCGTTARFDAGDNILFSRVNWSAYTACAFGSADALYDLILAATAVTDIGTFAEYDALVVNVYGGWKTLDANDCAHLTANNGLGGNLYCGQISAADLVATAPAVGTSYGVYIGNMASISPPVLKFNEGVAGGGWIWLVG